MITSADPITGQPPSGETRTPENENRTLRPQVSAFKQTLEFLFGQDNAVSVVRWAVMQDGKLSADVLRGEFQEETQSAIGQAVHESSAQNSTLSKLFQAESASHVIAAPLIAPMNFPSEKKSSVGQASLPDVQPTRAGQTLTVAFHRRPSSQIHARLRQQQVELAAAYLSIERLSQEVEKATKAPSLMVRFQAVKEYLIENRLKVKTYLLAAAALGLIGFCPWKHSVKAKVTCEPAIRRFVSAPFDAKVVDSKVKPGDYVTQDQILARLDGSDLRSKIAALQAKYDQAVQRQSAALSTVDATKVAIEQLEVQHLKSEIELLQDHQRRLEIRAPISGVVISGDLERAAGATMGVGETIYEIATLENMVAEIAIPESEISYTENVRTIEIAIEALPGERQTTSLQRIHPRSEIIENNSVYVGEAELPNKKGLLRPGMKGTATLHVGYRPIGWLLLHKPYEVLRTWGGW